MIERPRSPSTRPPRHLSEINPVISERCRGDTRSPHWCLSDYFSDGTENLLNGDKHK